MNRQPDFERGFLIRADTKNPGGNYVMLTGRGSAAVLYQYLNETEYRERKQRDNHEHNGGISWMIGNIFSETVKY